MIVKQLETRSISASSLSSPAMNSQKLPHTASYSFGSFPSSPAAVRHHKNKEFVGAGLKSSSSEYLISAPFYNDIIPMQQNDSLLDLFPDLLNGKKADSSVHINRNRLQQQHQSSNNSAFNSTVNSPLVSRKTSSAISSSILDSPPLFGHGTFSSRPSNSSSIPSSISPPSKKRSKSVSGRNNSTTSVVSVLLDNSNSSTSSNAMFSSKPTLLATQKQNTIDPTKELVSTTKSINNADSNEILPTAASSSIRDGINQTPGKLSADQLAIRLAQHACDVSTLPKRVKMLRDLSDDIIEQMQDMSNPMEGMATFDDPNSRDIGGSTVMTLANSLVTGSAAPLKYIVLGALTTPMPRSVGTPTNVSVPVDQDVDGKTLKRLRNRISASRCRLRKRIWAVGLEKCEQGLKALTNDLRLHVDTLERERNALLQLLSLAERK